MHIDDNMQSEEWRDVVGYEGLYEVCNWGGKVRTLIGGRWGKNKGAILAPKPMKNGYIQVHLAKDRKQYTPLVHQLVAAAFIGACPPLHEVNHKDGNKENNNANNLEYLTKSQNQKHSYDELGRQGAVVNGERNGMSKLTEPQVREILRLAATTNMRHEDIAVLFSVSKANASKIIAGQLWRHVRLTEDG